MSTPPQPPVTPGPDEPYTLSTVLPTSPPPKRRVGLFIGMAVAVLVAGGLGAGAVALVVADKDDSKTPPAVAAPSPTSSCAGYSVDADTGAVVCKPAGAADVVNEQPQYATPKAGDFKITVKILEKKCYGSAGCLVTFRIDPQYTGAPLDPSVTWLVTYEVRGVEDGPMVNTFEVTGDEASFDSEENAQTPTTTVKLSVKVTEILRG